MKTTKFYNCSYYNEHTDDGMALLQAEYTFLNLDKAIEFCEKDHCDYITPDEKLHVWTGKGNEYKIISDPSDEYRETEGIYLSVWIIDEAKLYFHDVSETKTISIEVED